MGFVSLNPSYKPTFGSGDPTSRELTTLRHVPSPPAGEGDPAVDLQKAGEGAGPSRPHPFVFVDRAVAPSSARGGGKKRRARAPWGANGDIGRGRGARR